MTPRTAIGIGADLYTADEMAQAERPSPVAVVASATARERLAARRAELRTTAAPIADATEIAPAGTDDETPRELTLEAFLALVAAAGISRAAVATAAAEVFPGVGSRDYTDAHWGAVADRLGLPGDDTASTTSMADRRRPRPPRKTDWRRPCTPNLIDTLPPVPHPANPAAVEPTAGEPGAVVRLVRDGAVPRASCPHCGGQLQLSTAGSRWQVRCPGDVADRLTLQLGTLEREELHVLLLDAKNVVIDQERVYQGNVSASVVRVGELFTAAVRRQARAILIVHNHPSGDPSPSPDDLHLTAEAIAAGRLLDVDVLDHVIVGGGAWVSLRDRGVTFDRLRRDMWSARRPRSSRLVLHVENGQVVDDDGRVYDVREAIENIPWVTAIEVPAAPPTTSSSARLLRDRLGGPRPPRSSSTPMAYMAFFRAYQKPNRYWDFEGQPVLAHGELGRRQGHPHVQRLPLRGRRASSPRRPGRQARESRGMERPAVGVARYAVAGVLSAQPGHGTARVPRRPGPVPPTAPGQGWRLMVVTARPGDVSGCTVNVRSAMGIPARDAVRDCRRRGLILDGHEAWDRQLGETSRGYALFATYRDLGPLERSLGRVARDAGGSLGSVQQLSRRNSWVARAEAWDSENDRQKRALQAREREQMARRQVLAGQLLMSPRPSSGPRPCPTRRSRTSPSGR